MGWSRDPHEWDTDQVTDAADMISSGCRAAYYPPGNWNWSFLQPNFSITTLSERREYDLPHDFASLVGGLTYSADDSGSCSLHVVSDQAMRVRYQDDWSITSGQPQEAALRNVRPTADRASRWQLVLWPEPDAVYTLTGQCVVQPETLSDDYPHPYGDAAFQEALLDAILMQVGRKLGENDGRHAEAFARSLASAQRVDAGRRPDTLGINRDRSDRPEWNRTPRRGGSVTLAGWTD